MIKLILFDLDGTIIDSEIAALQAILECTQKWGVDVKKEEAAQVVGQKWDVAFDLLYSKHRMPLPREEASACIVGRFQELVRSDLQVVPGVAEAIHDFASHFRLGLVTGSVREDAFWALDKVGVRKHFEVVYGAEDYPNSKPAPDGYLKALSTFGIPASNALIFEDSVPGLASAHAAGVRSVAVTCANHFGHDQSLAARSIPDFRGIGASWVRKHFP